MLLGHVTRRVAAWCALLLPPLMALLSACYSAKPADQAALERAEAKKHRLRLTYPNGNVIIMPGWRLQYPFVEGEIDESQGVVPSDAVERSATFRKFNLDETTRVESYKLSAGKVAGLSAGGFVGAMLILAALLAAACSCPTVYVVDGPQETIVGQAYPGAIFRSVQREDLLPLPHVEGSTLTLRLRNENPEIQYTDWASLAIVEHAPEQRALASHDGHPVIVNGSQAPRQVVDLNGQDVSDRLRAIDDQVWQSDLDSAFRSGRRELREGLVAMFERPPEGPLALEITAESTLWMSVVFHRGLTMMGSAFGAVVSAANQADRAGIDAWRGREGVDLRVEVLRRGAWHEVAMVQTPGVATLRTMAIPLGDVDGGELRVRLSGGFGFWRIGSLALTRILDDAPEVTTVAAQGGAHRLVGEKDARYHVLQHQDEFIDLTFALPQRGTQARSAFLATSGYYNPLPPSTRIPQLATLRAIRNTPGAMAGFGIDLYARHRDQLHEEHGR